MSDELIRQLRYEADANAAEVRRLAQEHRNEIVLQWKEAFERACDDIATLKRERDEARRALDALIHLIRQHRCNCDRVMPVGECVDSGRCGCSAALLTRAISTGEG
jgi:acyl-CoA reductase-like NAD-dependent aldehyde dehydrogenase